MNSMDKAAMFDRLKSGVKDLAEFYLEDGSEESRSILEDHIKNLQNIANRLQIPSAPINNDQIKSKINELASVAATQLQNAPTMKNFQFLDKLIKTLRVL